MSVSTWQEERNAHAHKDSWDMTAPYFDPELFSTLKQI